ncbi:hypothetical protein [Rathayibacter sp. VKM Ac-2857]|uniref:hypothetical protein n=1 Tax=Rathayibacter sp. VKM Ac-2857 TaxID=2739020 RepID=UPI001566501B|nr:hypothetical protein [Rathayibacter sp. VKM Ac-2857]NQX15085.1 hypothetical protein [Rathayibacter sp. VKM Ac-2857]
MRVKLNADDGFVDAPDDLHALPAFVLELAGDRFVYVERLSTFQWVMHNTAPDTDGVAEQDGARFPLMNRVGYLNRRPDGGWIARFERDAKLVSLSGDRIEVVVAIVVRSRPAGQH